MGPDQRKFKWAVVRGYKKVWPDTKKTVLDNRVGPVDGFGVRSTDLGFLGI